MAKNIDDAIDRLGTDTLKIRGRSAQIRRRMDMIVEEVRGVQMNPGRGFACSFGIAIFTTSSNDMAAKKIG